MALHDGVEVDTQGDAFLLALPDAGKAIGAAVDAQQSLKDGPINVRMGVHTGTPLLGARDTSERTSTLERASLPPATGAKS